jgi:hypothetical protein
MKSIGEVLSWAKAMGIGGAFFILAIGAFLLSGMAMWVVLIALELADS